MIMRQTLIKYDTFALILGGKWCKNLIHRLYDDSLLH